MPAVQPGFGRNATQAIQNAIKKATAAGGGVVSQPISGLLYAMYDLIFLQIYLPRGQYFVTGPIVLPEATVLRGAARELSAIYFAEVTK